MLNDSCLVKCSVERILKALMRMPAIESELSGNAVTETTSELTVC